MGFMSRSIQARLFVCFSVLGAAVAGITGAMWYREESKAIIMRLDEEETGLAAALSMLVNGDELQRLANEGPSSPMYAKYQRLAQRFRDEVTVENAWAYIGSSNEKQIVAFIYPEIQKPGETFAVPKGTFQEAIGKALHGKMAVTGIFTDNLGTWKTGVYPITDKYGNVVGEVGVDIKAEFVSEALGVARNQAIMVALLAIFASIGTAFFLSRNINRPIRATTDAIERVATGDLTIEELDDKAQDELGLMAKSLNQMLRSYKSLIAGITVSTKSVALAAGDLNAASEQSAQAAQNAAQAVQQLAEGSAKQAAVSDSTKNTMEQLQQTIQQIASGSQQTAGDVQQALARLSQMVQAIDGVASNAAIVTDNTTQAASMANNGAEVVRQAIEAIAHIETASNDSATRIQELAEFSNRIGQITEVISGVADQTNLLALNAAIEAARAGEHGRGFAVVAEEVRKLAERSDASAREIAALIADIQTRTTEAVKAMDAGSAAVQTGSRLAKDAGEALKRISTAMETTAQEVQTISKAAQKAREDAQQVLGAFDSVAAVTEESTAGTEQMAAAASEVTNSMLQVAPVAQSNAAMAQELSSTIEELSASSEEVASSATSLHTIAQDLMEQVSQFKVPEKQDENPKQALSRLAAKSLPTVKKA